MILTSNRGFAEWGEVFGDPVVATALLDRLLHHAVVVQIEGSSYRRKRKPLDTFVCVAAARNLSAWNVRRRLRLGIGRTSTRTRLFRALVRNRSSFGSVRNGIADGALRIGCGLSGRRYSRAR
jgi:hypothetical protein